MTQTVQHSEQTAPRLGSFWQLECFDGDIQPPRRPLQFGLATVLVAVAVAAIFLAWLGSELRYGWDRRALRELLKEGGAIVYVRSAAARKPPRSKPLAGREIVDVVLLARGQDVELVRTTFPEAYVEYLDEAADHLIARMENKIGRYSYVGDMAEIAATQLGTLGPAASKALPALERMSNDRNAGAAAKVAIAKIKAP